MGACQVTVTMLSQAASLREDAPHHGGRVQQSGQAAAGIGGFTRSLVPDHSP